MSDNVVSIAAAIDKAQKATRKPRDKGGKGGGSEPPSPPPTAPSLPERLPDDAPVKALGTNEGMYFYLDSRGQLRRLPEEKHGRLHIISLFGGIEYLEATWPVWQMVEGVWVRKKDFAHARLAPVLMSSCCEKGVWDPVDKVRGCGTWIEDDGSLVMHCGSNLFVNRAGVNIRLEAGIRGGLLYPRRPPLPEPSFDQDDPGTTLLDKLETWHFRRGEIDACIVMGWVMAAMIGQAAPWRPMMWVTGGKATGKSTLQKLIEWLLGPGSLIKPANTTQAYVYQRIGDSALPVALDEFEAKQDNRRQDDVIELMRIAASGGELGRGGSEGTAKTFTLRSCFSAFSILIPPLPPQDRSRMAIVELLPLQKEETDPELDMVAPADHDLALGSREKWTRVGAQLRGRVLSQWPRYLKTFQAYFNALVRAGHDMRAASQFGALGAGYDLARFEKFDLKNAQRWAQMLPSADLAETKGYSSEPESCLQHLLAAQPDVLRSGTRETVAHYIRRARKDAEEDARNNDPDDAGRVLAKIGIRVFRDPKLVSFEGDREVPVWWVAVSSTHPALAEIFRATHWKGRAGAPGTWAQALRGLPGAAERAKEMRIDGHKNWVTPILYDAMLPPISASDDADEIETVDPRDREKIKAERGEML